VNPPLPVLSVFLSVRQREQLFSVSSRLWTA
jgi:hypothetical protein